MKIDDMKSLTSESIQTTHSVVLILAIGRVWIFVLLVEGSSCGADGPDASCTFSSIFLSAR